MTRRFRPASAQMPDGHVVEQLEAAFLHAPTGVALVAADGRFVRVNPALARLLGRSEGELHQLRWQDLMRDLPAVEAAAGGALCRASALDDEFRTRRADGAELLHQPDLLTYFQERLQGMPEFNSKLLQEIQAALGEVRPLIDVGDTPITPQAVKRINEITTRVDEAIVTKTQ